MEVYSLSRVIVTISNETFGSIQLGGGSNRDEIVFRRTNPAFSKEDSADGNSVITHNANKSGEIDITLKQTSRVIGDLEDFFNFCQDNPSLAESRLVAKDEFGVIDVLATGLFPTTMADNTAGQTASSRTFPFIAANIDFQASPAS